MVRRLVIWSAGASPIAWPKSGVRPGTNRAARRPGLKQRMRRRRTRQHVDDAHALLAQEVADLDLRALVLDVGVDREMRVHEPHLVLEADCYALNQVLRAPSPPIRMTPQLRTLQAPLRARAAQKKSATAAPL